MPCNALMWSEYGMPEQHRHMVPICMHTSCLCVWLSAGVYRKPGPQLPGAIGAFSVGLSPEQEQAAAEQDKARMVRGLQAQQTVRNNIMHDMPEQ
jgi:hypothetical protein